MKVLKMMEEMIDNSEQDNLEYTLNGIGVDSYTWLLAYYFHQGEMCKAEYLWNRVPIPVKQRNPEFEAVWKVGNRLWEKDTTGFYQAVGAYQWTALTRPIIAKITENVRDESIRRISTAYSSIPIQDLATLLCLSVPEVKSEVIPKTGWVLKDDVTVKISDGEGKESYPHQFTDEGRGDMKKIIDLLHFLIVLVILVLIHLIFVN